MQVKHDSYSHDQEYASKLMGARGRFGVVSLDQMVRFKHDPRDDLVPTHQLSLPALLWVDVHPIDIIPITVTYLPALGLPIW